MISKQKLTSKRRVKHLHRHQGAEIYGWIGAFGILIGYALLSLGLIKGNSYLYHGIVLVSSSGLAVITYRHRAFQSLFVNTVFMLLAAVAIIRLSLFA